MTDQSDHMDSDWASTPGATLTDIMRERALSPESLAAELGVPIEQFAALLVGKAEINLSLAAALGTRLGPSAAFWTKRESRYRSALQRCEQKMQEAAGLAWLRSVPFAELSRWGWVGSAQSRAARVHETLAFFEATDIGALAQQTAVLAAAARFRTSARFPNLPGAVAAWIRRGEIVTRATKLPNWNPNAFMDNMPVFRRLTRTRRPEEFLPKLTRLCAECGVAMIVVRAPSGCRVSGAARFIDSTPTIQLSFRYLSDDQFWFTFFHEAGHLLLHDPNRLFLEGDERDESPREEAEASEFAEKTLIPPKFSTEFKSLPRTRQAVRDFAMRLGISPGIVVGQLQHHGMTGHGSDLNRLKARFNWETVRQS